MSDVYAENHHMDDFPSNVGLAAMSPNAFATLVNQLLTGVPGAVMPDIEVLVGEVRRRLDSWPQSLEGGRLASGPEGERGRKH